MGSARAQRGSVDPPERLVANRRLQNRELLLGGPNMAGYADGPRPALARL